ncbi:MAG: hypothetical protein WA921_08130 [Ahrensia sp.]
MLSVQDAISKAKQHVRDTFEAEGMRDVLLEGVELDRKHGTWNITISFIRRQSRPDLGTSIVGTLDKLSSREIEVRVFKVVWVDKNSGEMVRISDAESAIAAE